MKAHRISLVVCQALCLVSLVAGAALGRFLASVQRPQLPPPQRLLLSAAVADEGGPPARYRRADWASDVDLTPFVGDPSAWIVRRYCFEGPPFPGRCALELGDFRGELHPLLFALLDDLAGRCVLLCFQVPEPNAASSEVMLLVQDDGAPSLVAHARIPSVHLPERPQSLRDETVVMPNRVPFWLEHEHGQVIDSWFFGDGPFLGLHQIAPSSSPDDWPVEDRETVAEQIERGWPDPLWYVRLLPRP